MSVKLRKSISTASAMDWSALSRTTSMKAKLASPGTARIRSARKNAAPLRMPRRNTSASPASRRISAATSRTRPAICSAVKTGLIVIHAHFVEDSGGIRHLEPLRHFHARDPDDLTVPDEQGEAVTQLRGDFTINQEVFQFFRTGKAEGLETIA